MWARLHAHSIPVDSLHPNTGIIQGQMFECSFMSRFKIPLWTTTGGDQWCFDLPLLNLSEGEIRSDPNKLGFDIPTESSGSEILKSYTQVFKQHIILTNINKTRILRANLHCELIKLYYRASFRISQNEIWKLKTIGLIKNSVQHVTENLENMFQLFRKIQNDRSQLEAQSETSV